MKLLSKRLPEYVPARGVMGRREDGAFILRVEDEVLKRMRREGWTVEAGGHYALATCPPPPLPDIPNHQLEQ